MILKSIASILGAATAYGLYLVLKTLYRELTSPLRYIRGPHSTHWFYGNLKGLINDEAGFEENLVREYGRTWKFHRFFGQSALYSTDPKALHHFLSNTHVYQKSEASRFSLGQVVGPGILVVEGEQHKQQNPAFGIPQIRELTEIFVDKSIQLRDIWAAQTAKSDGVARVEALSWLSKATLDIIGLAGFNYKIDALAAEDDAPPNELAEAFEASFASDTGFSFIRFLQMRYPLLRRIPLKRDKIAIAAQQTMKRIGRELLASSKREVSENGTFETGSGRARDLLTLLVRANTSKDVPAHQRLSDEDVIAQVPTFLVAGHGMSISTAVTWTLFALTQNPAAQTRLREELLAFPTDRPTLDELNSLRYLDCVVRETLRVHAPVTMTGRMAMQDDVVPLSTPVTDSRGEVHESIRIRKGDQILIPILALNHDTDIWGPDAMEFRPERWETDIPEASAIPGVWGHMMTFIGGPRSCIGFRFSLAEMKALIFTLVRAFEFELAVPREEMGATGNSIVLRPAVMTDLAAGNQLPLVVKTVVR
ncbi:cytochrome P450 [Favolaschia claudopus]|uniref:Cytochrome P450 n=1 Tax=Favolaschia claudopus TaxID=2862362 RepID=A0AAV9ZM83_9AGAR